MLRLVVILYGFSFFIRTKDGHEATELVEALHYKSEGRGFYSRRGHWDFSLTESFQLHYGPGADPLGDGGEW